MGEGEGAGFSSREWFTTGTEKRERAVFFPLSFFFFLALPFSLFYNLKKPMTDKVREGDMADATHSSEVETKRAS